MVRLAAGVIDSVGSVLILFFIETCCVSSSSSASGLQTWFDGLLCVSWLFIGSVVDAEVLIFSLGSSVF